MAEALILKYDARCACCLQPMKAGEPFRWLQKSGTHFRGVQNAPGRTLVAHIDPLCDAKRQAEITARIEAEAREKANDNLIRLAVEAGIPEAEVRAALAKAEAA